MITDFLSFLNNITLKVTTVLTKFLKKVADMITDFLSFLINITLKVTTVFTTFWATV